MYMCMYFIRIDIETNTTIKLHFSRKFDEIKHIFHIHKLQKSLYSRKQKILFRQIDIKKSFHRSFWSMYFNFTSNHSVETKTNLKFLHFTRELFTRNELKD